MLDRYYVHCQVDLGMSHGSHRGSGGSSRHQIKIIGERQNENGWYTVFGCPYCGRNFAMIKEDVDKLVLPIDIAPRVKAFIPFETEA